MTREGKKHIYILPAHFEGIVVIFYEQKSGSDIEYAKDGSVVFNIPTNGILKTKMEFAPTDLKNNAFWYAGKTSIPYREDVGSLNDSISALGLHYGNVYRALNGTPIKFEILYIANKKSIDSLANAGESLKLLDLLQ